MMHLFHRAKSMSTPALAGLHKQAKGKSTTMFPSVPVWSCAHIKPLTAAVDQKRSKGQSVSKAEHDRQQILEEMKKRTQLLTDNSWIRQRSTSVNKEPVGAAIKR